MANTLKLPVRLTEADRLNISADQTAAIKAQEEVEAAKKLAVSGFNAKIKEHKKTVHEMNEALLAGVIHREVEVRDEKDYVTGKTRTIRLDTGEEVISKDIDPDERQTVLGLPSPGATVVGLGADTADEQSAATPEEAEHLREERLSNERAERISAAVSEARGRITVLPLVVLDGDPPRFRGTVQAGGKVIEEEGFSEAQTVAAVAASLTEWAEAEEAARPEPAATWEDAKAASAEADRQREIERLAAEQKEDQKKNGPKNLLRAPKKPRARKIKVTDGEGRELDEDGNVKAEPPADDVPPPVDEDKPLAF